MEWREGDMAIQGRGKERRRQGHTGKRKGEKKTRPYREEGRRVETRPYRAEERRVETRPYRAEQKGHINGEIGKEMRIESRGEEWDEQERLLSTRIQLQH
ncbi:unnamed protein product [Boreogadus saida]